MSKKSISVLWMAVFVICFVSACSWRDKFSEDSFSGEIESYPLDTKQYRYLRLDNGLKALLISDSKATKASASLNVSVGSFHDPKEWEGLAHFLEHILFLGTEKYPEADAYTSYLEMHGGRHNAYTAYDMTNYHFSVSVDGFEGALDRFSQFFVSPLFTEEYVNREKSAVHSEYFTRINDDQIRSIEAFESIINKKHPAFKFNAGNIDTLADKPGEKARDVLIDFYNAHYSSDKMTLALVSNHSLDDLENMVFERFSEVRKIENVENIKFPDLFAKNELPMVLEVEPVKDQYILSLIFPMPVMVKNYKENPVGYISAMLGAEGEESLRDRLKARGWITGFGASSGLNYGDKDTFTINVGMTKEGLSRQDEVISALFDQVNLIKTSGVSKWRYNEIKNLSEVNFRYSENSALDMQGVIDFSIAMQHVSPSCLINSGFQRFDGGLIDSVLEEIRPDNMVVMIMAPGVKTEKKTRFYGAKYRAFKPDSNRISRWRDTIFHDLSLPERNSLIPGSFKLEKVVSLDEPVKLDNSEVVELWHYPNIEEGVPRASITLAIDRPERPSLRQIFIQQFYFALMGEQLQDIMYNASRAGMSFRFTPAAVNFSGYSNKLKELSDLVLSKVLNPRFTQQQFGLLKDSVIRDIQSAIMMSPVQGLTSQLEELLNADSYTIDASARGSEFNCT